MTNLDAIGEIVQEIKPDIVVHFGAMTGVDLCESQQDLALKINSKSTETLGKQVAK